MRISDWSSDVCSSDLIDDHGLARRQGQRAAGPPALAAGEDFAGGAAPAEHPHRMADHFGFAGHHRSAMQPPDVAEQQDENGTAGGGRGAAGPPRSEARRGGTEWVSTCRTWGTA